MNNFVTSVDSDPGVFICTWDLGRRCNFDCTYCGDDTHDNVSPHSALDQLKSTVDFIYEYVGLMMSRRINKDASLSLTGGEPTVHPMFKNLCLYLMEVRAAKPELRISHSLTTNGSFSKQIFETITRTFDGMTISYHCDSKPEMRAKVRDNILAVAQTTMKFKVNVMFHNDEELFKECAELSYDLRAKGIRFVPRIINGFTYTDEQAQWFQDFWKSENTQVTRKKEAVQSPEIVEKKKPQSSKEKDGKFITGRHCCMKIPLKVTEKGSDAEQTVLYCADNKFTGWYCGINWKFLHIDQQRDQILHHQTCQASWGKTRGPIGKATEWRPVIEKLKADIEKGTMEAIQCTLPKCFCGMCATKSAEFGRFQDMMKKHAREIQFVSAP